MNRIAAFFVAIIAITQQLLFASAVDHVDLRISAFSPSDKLMREIYGNWQVNYEIEAGKCICPNYELWANLGYFSKEGQTRALHTRTQFANANLSCGAKYLFCICPSTQLYLGAGINGAYVYVHNNSHYVKYNVRKGGVGGVFKLGIYFRPMENLFFELFSDYLYQTIHFEKNVQIGGVKIGAGAGIDF